MGVATISTDCPSGPADLIEHMHNGVLVPVDDVQAVAKAMDQLMSAPALRQSLGSCAMSVRERLSTRCIVAKWHSAQGLTMPGITIAEKTIPNPYGEEH